MKIKVRFKDGEVESVASSTLNELISMREIVAFQRSDGWVNLGQTPVRKKLRPYRGPGRRAYDIFLGDVLN